MKIFQNYLKIRIFIHLFLRYDCHVLLKDNVYLNYIFNNCFKFQLFVDCVLIISCLLFP